MRSSLTFLLLVVVACAPATIGSDADLPDASPDSGADTSIASDSGALDTNTDTNTDTGSPSTSYRFDPDAVRTLAQSYVTAMVPALAVAIVSGDEVVFAEGFGTTRSGGPAVSPETLFCVGSVSKMLTGLAVTILEADGEIALDAPMTTYVPYVSVSGADASAITTRHLLTHTSGIGQDFDDIESSLRASFTSPLRPWAPPGVLYNYSNSGINLAGLIAAEAHRKTIAETLSDTTFRALAMPNATANPTEAMRNFAAGIAIGYPEPTTPTDVAEATVPSGGIWLSANDLGQLALALAGHGPLDNALRERWLRPRVETRYLRGESYGYGVFVEQGSLPHSVTHSGSFAGYLSEITAYPEANVAVAVVMASDHGDPFGLERRILELADFQTRPDPSAPEIVNDESTFAGDYFDPFYFRTLRVARSGAGFSIQFVDRGGATQTLEDYGDGVFGFTDPADGWSTELSFWPGPSGAAQYIVTRLGVATKR